MNKKLRTIIIIICGFCCGIMIALILKNIDYQNHLSESRAALFPTTKEVAQQIVYVKDERTGLCFVHNLVYTDINSDVFTYVPCTPEVIKLIK